MNNQVKNQLESEGSPMDKVMSDEFQEAIAMLEKANRAFTRLFGEQGGENE